VIAHIRKIIKRNLNYAIKNSNLEEILELEGEKRIIPLKFTKGGETFYAITKQKEVITLYNEEMYNNDLKWRADKISNKYYSSYATT